MLETYETISVTYKSTRPATYWSPEKITKRVERQQPFAPVTYQKDWSFDVLFEKYDVANFCNDLDDIDNLDNLMNSIYSALRLLSKLGQKANIENRDLQFPELNPAGNDSVDLFWRGNPRLSVNFSKALNTYGFFGKSKSRGTIKGVSPIDVVRYDILTWLTEFNV